MKSSNQMWKLDLLESKFNNASPRYPHTKKLLIASNHNAKLLKKLPKTTEDAQAEIDSLKSEIFQKKYHSGYTKLLKEVNKKPVPVKEDDFVQKLITAKLIKSIQSSILNSKELKSNPPQYISKEVRDIITDKENDSNPSKFYIKYCQNDKEVNKFVANLWNNKNVKKLLDEIEWSFKIVRGDLTKSERDARSKITGKNVDEDVEEEDDDESSDDEEEDNEYDVDLEKEYDNFAVYDNLEEGSDVDQTPDLDPSINYNEVTDEEPSEDESSESDSESSHDDFFEEEEQPAKKKQKKEESTYKLPELASGYFSGGSDDEDDADNDKVVKELTTQRKNRRGQRARQKIWAQKYGKEAAHIKKNIQRVASEREQRQLEYEERQRKREMKAKMLEEKQTGANALPLGERKAAQPQSQSQPVEPKSIHPSWEAKQKEKEKLKNITFQGKKVVFD